MAEYSFRDVTIVRREYTLPNPTNWAEINKVVAALEQELEEEGYSDDRVTVEARDDEIVFWYEKSSDA